MPTASLGQGDMMVKGIILCCVLLVPNQPCIHLSFPAGSVCTTRTKTGVGYPQLSAVIECADSAHGLKGHIISVSITRSGSLWGPWGDHDYGPGPQGPCCLQRTFFFQILSHSTCIKDLDVRMNLRGADIGHRISDPGVGKCFGK